MSKLPKPDCWKCKYRANGSSPNRISCKNPNAIVKGSLYAIRLARFQWPTNFWPEDLNACDSFEPKGKQ